LIVLSADLAGFVEDTFDRNSKIPELHFIASTLVELLSSHGSRDYILWLQHAVRWL
jgi:hypothetical protein